MVAVVVVFGLLAIIGVSKATVFRGGPLNLSVFNERFIAANNELMLGTTEGLKEGIRHLVESLEVAGDFASDVIKALQYLRCALSHHDRADTKGPWNRDLSGYGLMSWKNDLYDRDTALRQAWPHIAAVNDRLKKLGFGWNF